MEEGGREGWNTVDDSKEGEMSGPWGGQWKKGWDIKDAQEGWDVVGDGTWERGMGWSSTGRRKEVWVGLGG